MAEEVWKIIYREEYVAPPPPPPSSGGTGGSGTGGGRTRPSQYARMGQVPPDPNEIIPPDADWPIPPLPSPGKRTRPPKKGSIDPIMEGMFKAMSGLGLGGVGGLFKSWKPFFSSGPKESQSTYSSGEDMASIAGAFQEAKARPKDFAGQYDQIMGLGGGQPKAGAKPGVSGGGEAIRDLGNTNKGQLKEALKIGALFTGIAGSITFLVSLLKRSKIFSTFMDSFLTILGAIVDIMLIPLIPFFGAVLKGMGKSIPVFLEMSQMIGEAIGSLLSGTWLNDLFQPLLSVLEFLPKIFNEIVAFFSDPVQWMIDVFEKVFSFTLGGASDFGVAIINEIWKGMQSVWNEVTEWGSRIINGIWDGIVIAWNFILEWGGKILTAMWDGIVLAFNTVLEWGGKILGWMWDGMAIAFNTVIEWGGKILGWIWDGIVIATNTVLEWGGKILGWMGDGITAAMNIIIEYGGKIIGWIGEGIGALIETVKGWGTTIIGWIGETIGGMIETVKSWGGNVVGWFINGIETAIDSVKSVARKIIDTFVDVWNETIGRIPGLHLSQEKEGAGTGIGTEGYKAGWDQLFGGQSILPSTPSKVEWYEIFNEKYWDEYLKPAVEGLVGALGDFSADLTYAGVAPLEQLFNLGRATESVNTEMSGVGNTIGTQVDPALVSAASAANTAATNITSASNALISKMNSASASVTTSNAWDQLTPDQQQDINTAVFMGGLSAPSAILGGAYNELPPANVYSSQPTLRLSPANQALLYGGEYQHGSPFIPRDMMAQIHKGEAVIPEELNKIFAPMGGAMNALKEMASGGLNTGRRMANQEINKALTQLQSRHMSIHNTFNITKTPDRELPRQIVESMEEQIRDAWQRIS